MRKGCYKCALKHLAQAMVLLLESKKGYPIHRWLAVGHMAEAEDELNEVSYKTLIRDYRHKVMDGEDVKVVELIEVINQEVI